MRQTMAPMIASSMKKSRPEAARLHDSHRWAMRPLTRSSQQSVVGRPHLAQGASDMVMALNPRTGVNPKPVRVPSGEA